MNVYGTAVTDAGLKPLEKLPRLRSVYAWQTQVTPQGAEALQAALKKVHVNVGAPPTPVVTEDMTADDTKGKKDKKPKKEKDAAPWTRRVRHGASAPRHRSAHRDDDLVRPAVVQQRHGSGVDILAVQRDRAPHRRCGARGC